MFRQVFDPENFFWRWIARGVDFVGLSLIWVFLSIPVITAGPATSALYYTVVKVFRQDDQEGFRTYWKTFRENFRQGCLTALIWIPIIFVFAYFYSIMAANTGTVMGDIMYMAYWVALLVPAGIFCWIWPVQARFQQGIAESFAAAINLSLRHLPSTFVVVLLWMELIIFTIERWWPIFITPVAACLLGSLFYERIFVKYLNEEEREMLEGNEQENA